MILAGIDEAGYGPTLGPLVVSVTVFRVEGPSSAQTQAQTPDLWHTLKTVVGRKPDGRNIAVNDSKKLFTQKRGLRHIEEGLLPFVWLTTPEPPRTLRALIDALVPCTNRTATAYLDDYPWHAQRDVDLPSGTYPGAVTARRERLAECLESSGVEIVGLRSYPLEVFEFNSALEAEANKANVSFRAIGAFLKQLWKSFPEEPVDVVVDRQGGRRYYGPQLFRAVGPRSLRVETQTENCSIYGLTRRDGLTRHGSGSSPFRVTFATKGDALSLPVALASMLSKYVRELHMGLFNEFWREHLADLKPTAGYAVDARRFLHEIAPLRRRLEIDDRRLIRGR